MGKDPIVATAIHDGHLIRPELESLFKLTEAQRLREEDPFTAAWVSVSDSNIIFHHSRFEVDVNRPEEGAVYQKPEDAWGLDVWKDELDDNAVAQSLDLYYDFYKQVKIFFDQLFESHDKLVVYDIHSYNHRRESPDQYADPTENPEVNIGSQNMNTTIWSPVVSTLIHTMKSFNYNGRSLDVRENIKFKGGYFGKFLFNEYGDKICPISIEFKKFFMDEWTGKSFEDDIQLIGSLLKATKEPVIHSLKQIQVH